MGLGKHVTSLPEGGRRWLRLRWWRKTPPQDSRAPVLLRGSLEWRAWGRECGWTRGSLGRVPGPSLRGLWGDTGPGLGSPELLLHLVQRACECVHTHVCTTVRNVIPPKPPPNCSAASGAAEGLPQEAHVLARAIPPLALLCGLVCSPAALWASVSLSFIKMRDSVQV